MLDWLSGPHGSAPQRTSLANLEQSYIEPPETPAHIFAVRAFKTALFGTPAPPQFHEIQDEANESDEPKNNAPEQANKKEEKPIAVEDMDTRPAVPCQRNTYASPAKGILLTPGTGAARRKSVTFGAFGEKSNAATIGDTLDECVVLAPPGQSERVHTLAEKGDLRRSLFKKRISTPTQSVEVSSDAEPTTQDHRFNPEIVTGPTRSSKNDQNGSDEPTTTITEITVDLKSPRSKSGQHWKREYQRDHDKSMIEMRKLIKFGQAAKSYANKRDYEAIRLSEKLKETEEHVHEMEDKVSGLASQLTGARLQDDNQARILDDLASQTAQALRYKQKADRYRHALEEAQPNFTVKSRRNEPSPLSPTRYEDIENMRRELASLKKAADKAEKKAADLDKGNATLKRTLARVKEELKTSNARQQKKEERFAEQKKALKEKVAETEEQNRVLLARIHELSKSTSPAAVVYSSLQETAVEAAEDSMFSNNGFANRSVQAPALGMDTNVKRSIYNAPLVSQNPRNAVTELKLAVQRLDEAKRRAEEETLESQSSTRTKPKPLTENRKISPLVGESPIVNFKKKSFVAPKRYSQERDTCPVEILEEVPASPYPAVFSHVKHNDQTPIQRPTVISTPAHAPSPGGQSGLSSRMSSGSVREALPPDRIAAAKKRLEQRAASKQMMQVGGKENIRP